MNLIVEKCYLSKYQSIIIYGAGEIGSAMCKACEINNLKVNFIIDRKKCLHGTYLNNIEIISLDKIDKKLSSTPIVIASFEFLKQIKNDLDLYANKNSLKLKIYSFENV